MSVSEETMSVRKSIKRRRRYDLSIFVFATCINENRIAVAVS